MKSNNLLLSFSFVAYVFCFKTFIVNICWTWYIKRFSCKYLLYTEHVAPHLLFHSSLLISLPPDSFSSREIFTSTHTFHRIQSTVRCSLWSGRTSWWQQGCMVQQGFSPPKEPMAPNSAPTAGHHCLNAWVCGACFTFKPQHSFRGRDF